MFGRSEQPHPIPKSVHLRDVEPPKSVNVKVEKAQLFIIDTPKLSHARHQTLSYVSVLHSSPVVHVRSLINSALTANVILQTSDSSHSK